MLNCDLEDGFRIVWLDLFHLIRSQLWTTGNYSAIAILYTLQFIVAHTLGFSVFTSYILATDFQQSHCHLKSHKKSSFQSLTPFLPLFCNCQFRRLDSIQFYAPKLITRQAGVPKFDSSLPNRLLLLGRVFWLCSFVTPRQGHHGKESVFLTKLV
jgi:hypothetical protein